MYTLKQHLDEYRALNSLESVLGRSTLSGLRQVCFFGFAVATISLAGIQFTSLVVYTPYVAGVTLILLGAWLELLIIYFFHNSFYFKGLDSVIGSAGKLSRGCTYEVARVALLNESDVTKAFMQSLIGQEILLRLNISPTDISTFIGTPRTLFSSQDIPATDDQLLTLKELAEILAQTDSAFRTFLEAHAVSPELFTNTTAMCVNQLHRERRAERWWSRDRLSRTTGIGSELAYGVTYELERYSRSLYTSTIYSDLGVEANHIAVYCERIEHSLARDKSANILLIGAAGVGKMDIILGVAKRLKSGKGIHALHHAQFILLDTDRLFAMHGDKASFEQEFLILFSQAAAAGNCIIVIENIGSFITQAAQIGVAVPELMDVFLSLPALHVIGIDTPARYHTVLEPLGAFTRRFEEVLVEATDLSATTILLEPIALKQERSHSVLFTYTAINAIAVSADRYIVDGVMPDKAITLLLDTIGYASSKGIQIISDDVVYAYISSITGIPAGPVSDEERDLLLNLEGVLGARVVAQPAAVSAVAKTMRRARAHVERTDKPIGSFLFLGPTGVGKTETAKALAHVFFGTEEKMVRLDMSEFSGDDAVVRLIGNAEQTGLLSDQLREHPYTVVLLDEFEKAHPTAHDIFLQILDEGYCTDGRGEHVNARNTIIIATSNAGSDLIIKTSASRNATPILDQEIINHIISQKILKPELINRFDATIVFEPLKEQAQQVIASMFIAELEKRVRKEGYNVSVNRDVLPLIIEKGFNEQFGARPLGRAIQDIIEDKLSQLIIAGTLKKGDTMTLTAADFAQQ